MRSNALVCSEFSCVGAVVARNLCGKHYVRANRAGLLPNKQIRNNLSERFYQHVDDSNADGCHLWTMSKTKDGYGRIGIGRNEYQLAHRVSYELSSGSVIPKGMVVLHTCDNPPCVRYSHLVLGTQADNVKDMMTKGRHWSQM